MEVEAHGRTVDAGPRKQRIVLAALLCNANSRVSVDALAEALWGGSPPRTARKNIQVYLSTLRGLSRAGSGPQISHRAGGYVLHVDPAELDSLRFEELVRNTATLRRAGSTSAVADALGEALSLWRGRALDGMQHVPLLDAAAERLERQYLCTFEDWAEAQMEIGRGGAVVERITEVAHEHPMRERLRILQMTALCQADRRTEALTVYDELRRALARELGISPSPAVEAHYQSVLHGRVSAGRGSDRSRCRLPWDPPGFLGRTEATRRLTDVLTRGDDQLVVVSGPPGVGKSALAVHTAHRLADRYPDGRFLVRVRAPDGTPRPVHRIVAEVVPADQLPIDGPPDELSRAWRRWLAAQRALVVLDGARRESDVQALLPETGDSAVVVTARSRLSGLGAARRFTITPLAVPAALEFLAASIGAQRVAADPVSAERIVRATGLLPLALRLAAERLALLHYVPLREYAARLADPASLLDELGAGEETGRLQEAFADLPERARGAVRLGLLPDPVFTLAEAAEVLEVDEPAAVRILELLLEANLVTVPSAEVVAHEVQYEMLPLVFAHARAVASQGAVDGG